MSERNAITDAERAQWVDNDEGLYNAMRASRLSKRAFVAANRDMIDGVVRNVKSGRKPAHYLAYGRKEP